MAGAAGARRCPRRRVQRGWRFSAGPATSARHAGRHAGRCGIFKGEGPWRGLPTNGCLRGWLDCQGGRASKGRRPGLAGRERSC
jgi:hypothetical protein